MRDLIASLSAEPTDEARRGRLAALMEEGLAALIANVAAEAAVETALQRAAAAGAPSRRNPSLQRALRPGVLGRQGGD